MFDTPRLKMAGLLESEIGEAFIAQKAIDEMGSQIDNFIASLSLFDHCRDLANGLEEVEFGPPNISPQSGVETKTYKEGIFSDMRERSVRRRAMHERRLTINRWTFMSCREAVMSVYHFWQAMEISKASLKRCPTFDSKVNAEEMRQASKRMAREFPGREPMRQGIAHWVELHKSEKESAKHTMKQTYDAGGIFSAGGGIISGNLSGRTYQIMYRGLSHELELSNATFDKIQAIAEEFFHALIGALEVRHSRPRGVE